MKKMFCVAGLLLLQLIISAQPYQLLSPDKKLEVTVTLGDTLRYSLRVEGQEVMLPSPITMSFISGKAFGVAPKARKTSRQTINQTIKPVYGITQTTPEQYNELVIQLKDAYSVSFRAYNEGVAYRFISSRKDSLFVKEERSEFRFSGNDSVYFHPALSEALYRPQRINDTLQPNYSSLPVLVKTKGMNVLLHESDVLQYPCMAIKTVQHNTLAGTHALYPKRWKPGGHNNFNLVVLEEEAFIAKTKGTRSFPWRIVAIAQRDKDILANQLTYLLASEQKGKDWSWVKPGKVAWDWWNANNLSGVPFKTGFNTATYKYFIDFAAANGIQYVNLDEGWSDQFDLLKVTTELDMPEVIRYAKQKGIGLILWCVWHTLDRQMKEALTQFEQWGIAGLKVDFMDREDQVVVDFHERLLKEAAQRKMLVNYHGAYHPTGLQRTYPNNINVEAVRGLEWNKFNKEGTTPKHAVTIPFIRMFAGSMDYTPGAMQNYNETDWRQINDRPASQGTRCHQLAMYVVYYAPLQMLADAPTSYEADKPVLQFLSAVPTVWDETVALDGKLAEYVVVARRKGDAWYVGGMTDWTGREVVIDFSFLGPGEYNLVRYEDGPNAERIGNDYIVQTEVVVKGDKRKVTMAKGGGFVFQVSKK